ncbi:MAG: biosynthetic peptidoglycan transglycosylase [Oscillospiraceae bacterium]|nr:biosynthetic peptidoglycan transglycosylase [Oscillospiraceae bacterium]
MKKYEDYDDDELDMEEEAPKKKRGGFINRVLFFFAVIIVAVGTYVACIGYEMYSRAVTAVPVKDMAADIRSIDNYTSIEDIPDIYPDAVVSVEDKRFYSHHGIDLRSIGRAIVVNIRELSLAEGGSTITQQLAKNQYYTQEKSFLRKAAEAFTAVKIESELSKDDILELYINSIYYGDGCYGIYEASMHYFGVEPSEMSDYQCTLLAGIPNAPSVYAPTVNPGLAEERRIQVVDAMYNAEVISASERDSLLAASDHV